MKPARFIAPGLFVERQLPREGPSPAFVAWKPHVSQYFHDRSSLLKFIAWPAKTTTGDALREWLDSFDQEEPPAMETPAVDLATGFGPECHPEDNTRTII